MARPKLEENQKLTEVPCKVLPETQAKLASIAIIEDRPIGYLTRSLLLRGIAAYERDGRLKEPSAGEVVMRPLTKEELVQATQLLRAKQEAENAAASIGTGVKSDKP